MPKLPKQFDPEDFEDFEDTGVDEVMGNIISNMEYDHVPFEVKKDVPGETGPVTYIYCGDGTIKITISRDT